MAQPMKLSILIGADASGAKAGGAEASRALGGVTKAANDAGASINRLIGDTTGLNRAFASIDTRADDIAAYGAQMDALRGRYNPMFATISRYKAEVEGIRAAHRVGAISSAEMATAISKERQATLASIDAIKGRTAAVRTLQAANRNAGGSFQTSNIAAQGQDILVSAAMGMSPLQIALQQGTQLSAIFTDMKNPIRGIGTAMLSLISPVSLVTLGVVGLTAAVAQYAAEWLSSGNDSEEAIRRQRDAIAEVAQQWGDTMPALKAYYDELKRADDEAKKREGTSAAISMTWTDARRDVDGLNVSMADAVERLKAAGLASENIDVVQQTFANLKDRVDAGKASFEDVRNAQTTLAVAFNSAGIPAVDGMADAFKRLSDFVAEASGRTKALASDGTNELSAWAERMRQGTPYSEAMLKLQAYYRAQYNPVNIPAGTNIPTPTPRPNVNPAIDAESEATSKLNALLEENRQKLEQQRDALRNFLTTQNDSVARMQLEISLVGASVETRTRAIAAFEAEQKIRELGILTMGREAEAIRATAQERAGLQLQLERQQAAYQATQQAGSTMIDQLTVGTGSLRDRLKSMAETALTTFQQIAVANPLKNQLLGTNLPTLTDVFSKSASPLSSTTTGAMTVTAGTVMINGVPLGTGALDATRLLNPANQNLVNGVRPDLAAAGIVNNPLSATAPASNVEAYIRQSALARGIDPNVAVRVAQSEGGLQSWNAQSQVFKNGVQEQSFGPYQLYMGGGLGNRFQSQTGLDPRLAANGPAGVDFALDTAKQEGWGAWYGAKKAGISDWQGINPGVSTTSANSSQQITDNLTKLSTSSAVASSSVTSMATGAQTATAGLGDFSSGIGGFFQKLISGAFADGAAFSGGNVIPFATGGVVSKPTFFPMSGGRAGLMGEAGPEAIMPLERGAGGRLGVRASIPRGARQGGEVRLRYETANTLNIYGTSDQELLAQMRAGTQMLIDDSERRLRNSMPDFIESYRQNPLARYSG